MVLAPLLLRLFISVAHRSALSRTDRAPIGPYLMSIFFDMDTMAGGEFEKGLASLKALAER